MAGNIQGADQVIVELSDPEQARALLDGGTLHTVQNLEIGDLACQSKSDAQADAILIANYLARNTSLKRLSLTVDVPLDTALVQAFKFHPSLEILSLWISCIREVASTATDRVSFGGGGNFESILKVIWNL